MTSTSVPRSLAAWIDTQPVLLDAGGLEQLERRKLEEAEFHDTLRTDDLRGGVTELDANKRFYQAAAPVRAYVESWMQRVVPGKTFLDYACGNGGRAIDAAQRGAALAVGIDISPVSVQNATQAAASANVSGRTRFLQRDCEATGFPENSFDACLCSGMLHHLDLSRAFPELQRIMAPRGRILCVEALGYNPVIQWYRDRTPQLRTAWEKEHILTLRDVRNAQQWFAVENVRFHLMAAPAATLLPAAVRSAGIALGHALDLALTRIPLLQRWSWQFTFELVKR